MSLPIAIRSASLPRAETHTIASPSLIGVVIAPAPTLEAGLEVLAEVAVRVERSDRQGRAGRFA